MEYVIAVCLLFLLGKVGMAMERRVVEWVRVFWFPFEFTFRCFGWSWSGWKWAKGKYKSWKRKPAYGDARLATEAQLKPHRQPSGFCVGILNKKPIFTDPEACVVMFGIRGSGKSSTIGASLARAAGENIVVSN